MTQKQVHITWGIVVVILLGVIVYISLVNKNDYQPVTENQSTNNEFKNVGKTEESQIELNSDWKTYTNSQFSFEFKYPQDWYIVGKHTLVNNDAQLLSNYEREEDNNLPNLNADAENIFFKTYTVAKNTTLDDLKPKINVVSFDKFTTNAGLEGRKVVIYSEDQPVGNHTYFVFLQNNRVIHFSLGSMSEDQVKLLEKILGGFKFTSVVVSDWKTYTNAEYDFQFDYPKDASSVGVFENNGIRIDNLPNYQMPNFPEGKYMIQFSVQNATEPCQETMKSPQKFMIGSLMAYRGPALDGPYSGYPFNMCVLKDGKNFSIFISDGYKDGTIAHKVFDSFRFLK